MSNEHENKPLKRALALLDAAEAFYSDRNAETFSVPFSVFSKSSSLLEDVRSVEIACDRINKKKEPDLQVNVISRLVTENELTARSGVSGEPVTRQVIEVGIHIGDTSLLKKRRQEINAELALKESVPDFYFYTKGNQAFVGIGGSHLPEIIFKLKSDRFKLINLLHSKKKKMMGRNLQKELELTEDQFHKVVEGVRSRVSDAFNVGLQSFLVFDESNGYELTSLKEILEKP